MALPSERRLAAILFTDIVGYTALMASSEERGLRARERHRALVRPLVERNRGESIEATGDESLSVFPTVLDAVHCALAIEDQLREEPELRLHIGIHLGDVVVRDGEVSGDGVNIASRICALSPEGGIRVSGEVYRSIRNQPDIESVPLGEHELKNVGQPVAVFAVGRPGTLAAPTPSTHRRAVALRALAWAGVLAVLAAPVGWWMFRGPAAIDANPIRSLAVLPLENLSGDPTQEYFADGMTEALIGDLGKIGALRVTSRTSVMQYKGARKPLREIAAELGVDALLEGTVMREGGRVRVTAQLIDARSDHHLWSERYDRELGGVLELQSDVARAVAREVELELSPAEVARLANRGTVDPAAHDALLKGIFQLGLDTLEGTRFAIESFERATELEPDYALAHAWLGFAWWRRTTRFGFGAQGLSGAQEVVPPLEGMPKAKAAVLRALELDDTLAEAHEGLGRIAATFDWDFPAAVRHEKRALELNPSLPYPHVVLGFSLTNRGHHDEGSAEIRRAIELAPLDLSVRTLLAQQYLYARRYDDALAEARKVIEMDPGFGAAHRVLSRIHEAQRRFEDAIGDLERGETLSREQATELRSALSREGPQGYWRGWLRIAGTHTAARPDLLAKCHGELDELDQAFAELERAYEARIGQLTSLRVDPAFDSLRDDPRFDELVRRVGIPES